MGHRAEYVLTFSQELTQALSVLSEGIHLDVREAEQIYEATMERIEGWITASEAIDEKYRELNGAPGNPMSPVERGAKGGFYRRYEHGAIYFHSQIGARRVYGAIYQKYLQLGAEAGFLGYPLTDETGTPDGVGRYNTFQGGSIHWTPSTGAHETHGAIRDKWSSLGWEQGLLGYPTTDETKPPDGVGRYNHFERGSIYWTADTGAWEVHGAIRDKWASMGWETSYLGYPMTDEHNEVPGEVNGYSLRRISRFQHGVIVHSSATSHTTDLPDTVILASGALNPPEPITGWVELTINSAGFFSYKGHLHNSGYPGYHIAIASALTFQDSNGNVLVASEEGHVDGTTSVLSNRDHNWQHNGFQQLIRDNWDQIKHSGMTTTLKVNTTVGDVINVVLSTIPYAIAAIIAALLASGDLKACSPRGHIYKDATGEEHREVTIPIRRKDPNDPHHDPCID